eukprot:363501-Chlamydomonas_euryale.AAC.6
MVTQRRARQQMCWAVGDMHGNAWLSEMHGAWQHMARRQAGDGVHCAARLVHHAACQVSCHSYTCTLAIPTPALLPFLRLHSCHSYTCTLAIPTPALLPFLHLH